MLGQPLGQRAVGGQRPGLHRVLPPRRRQGHQRQGGQGLQGAGRPQAVRRRPLVPVQPVQGDAQPVPHGRLLRVARAEDVSRQGRIRHRRALHVHLGSVAFEVLQDGTRPNFLIYIHRSFQLYL